MMDKQQIKDRIAFLKQEENYNNAMQMAQKLVLNSWYGAFLNKFFCLHNSDIGSAITAMGRDLIQYMDMSNQAYWYSEWHKDTDIHRIIAAYNEWNREVTALIKKQKQELIPEEFKKKYGKFKFLDYVKELGYDYTTLDPIGVTKIDNTWIDKEHKTPVSVKDYPSPGEFQLHALETDTINRKYPVSCYCDTDSLFVSFEPFLNSLNMDTEGHEEQLIHLVYDYRLKNHFNDRLLKYAANSDRFNCAVDNVQDFEMERINESILFLQKKTYIQHVTWEDGTNYERLKYLYPKNVSLMKHSTPPFARAKIKDIINYLFAHPKDYNLKDFLKLVKDIKKQFQNADLEEISETVSCNNYGNYIINDKDTYEYKSGTPAGVKAGAYYNYKLNQTAITKPEDKAKGIVKDNRLRNKYEYIKSGNKMKFYYCVEVEELNDRFAYHRGAYPHEFAPRCDYDKQFKKTILENVNKYITALGLPELNERLSVILPLF